MLLDRILTEFEQEQAWIRHKMREIEGLVQSTDGEEPKELRDALLEFTAFRMELLKKHVKFINDWFSRYLTFRSMQTTYLLTVVVGIAEIISMILAILALLRSCKAQP